MSDGSAGKKSLAWRRGAKRGAALVAGAVFAALALGPAGVAHGQPAARCAALEQELANAANPAGGVDPRLKRINDAITRQQRERDKAARQSDRLQCNKTGFLIFQPRRPPECRAIRSSLERMTRNLNALNRERARMTRTDTGVDPVQRRILQALAQNNCGPQYRRYARRTTRFTLFGDPLGESRGGPFSPYERQPGRRLLGDIPTYRTMCVRTCDGYRFPVSFATLPSRFGADAAQCASMCPTAETELYYYPNPGGSADDLVSTSGQNYSAMPNAWRYQREVVEGCSCDAVTLQLEASRLQLQEQQARDERRIASLGADDAAATGNATSDAGDPAADLPQDAPSAASQNPSSQNSASQDTGAERSFAETPTVELNINFDDPDAEITERPAGDGIRIPDASDSAGDGDGDGGRNATIASEAGAGEDARKPKSTSFDFDKVSRQVSADYHPNRRYGQRPPSAPKNLR